MVYNIVSKPLGSVLIIAAHMVLNVSIQVEVTGILSSNITLQFTFRPNVSLTKRSHFAIYHNIIGPNKIAEYKHGKEGNIFDVYPKNASVFWYMENLQLNDSGSYWASLFKDPGPAKKSNKVQLVVREENRSNTVPPLQRKIQITEDGETSSHIVSVGVVSPVALLAAVLPCLIWCLVRNKDKQQQQPGQQSPNPTVQETVAASENVPAPNLVYSVLDFPKRPLAALETKPSDTEYATVSYPSYAKC